jgi:peptidoglycan/xylan/chitin deacetylase (PgdA/CDA1 family)
MARSGSTTSLIASIAFGILSLSHHPSRAQDIALTFDDLPVYGRPGSVKEASDLTADLVSGLVRRHLPAIGFVNEIQLEGTERVQRTALLQRWLDAGLDLGNHGYAHLSLTQTAADAYVADIARGQAVTNALLAKFGRHVVWFRHPFLETGSTPETRHEVDAWLNSHGYRVAPVTLGNSDWEFADLYDSALRRHDPGTAEKIRATYLAYTDRVIGWHQDAARQMLGRAPALVFLLHASRLNAASIDALADILERHDLHAVTLATAVADPAYEIPDSYVGRDGLSWLTRWSLTLEKPLPWKTLPGTALETFQVSDRQEIEKK